MQIDRQRDRKLIQKEGMRCFTLLLGCLGCQVLLLCQELYLLWVGSCALLLLLCISEELLQRYKNTHKWMVMRKQSEYLILLLS